MRMSMAAGHQLSPLPAVICTLSSNPQKAIFMICHLHLPLLRKCFSQQESAWSKGCGHLTTKEIWKHSFPCGSHSCWGLTVFLITPVHSYLAPVSSQRCIQGLGNFQPFIKIDFNEALCSLGIFKLLDNFELFNEPQIVCF